MSPSERKKTFTVKEIVEIFQSEVRHITDNQNDASNYATNAVKDFQNIYQGKIR